MSEPMSTDERRDTIRKILARGYGEAREDVVTVLASLLREGGSEKPGYFFFADTNEVVPWYEMARLASVGAGREVMAQVGFSFAAGTEKEEKE